MLLESFPSADAFRELAKTSNVIPVAAKVLADTETPVSVLARFQASAESLFLFESVEGGERWGRYSFMGTKAKLRVRVFREEVVVREGIQERRMPHMGKPMDVLREVMRPYRLAQFPGRPSFCGGLVGYFAYEMVHFFENRVPNKLPSEKPLADLMVPESLLVFDNVQNTLTVMSLAFLEEGADPSKAYANALAKRDALLAILETPIKPMKSVVTQRDLTPKPILAEEEFRANVLQVKEHVACGDIIQCVLSQSFVCEAPEDRLGLYRAQRHLNPSPYMYFLRMGGVELIGSSPETMIRLEHQRACLRPIAGTRPRGKTPQEDLALADELLKDEKERAEHLMLVDLGRNELGRVALPGTVQVTDLMIIERYSHVMHLVSNIVADLEPGHDAYDLLPSAFPAGTLSGAPKVRAMEIIAKLEKTPRGPYGGAVGYISFDGDMDFAICIRTAIIEEDRLTLRAGAGIVADSDPESERMETVNKAKSVARALELLTRNEK